MQFQADLLGIPVVRLAWCGNHGPGCGLSGRPVQRGVYQSTRGAVGFVEGRAPLPAHAEQGDRADELMQRWEQAVRQTTAQ